MDGTWAADYFPVGGSAHVDYNRRASGLQKSRVEMARDSWESQERGLFHPLVQFMVGMELPTNTPRYPLFSSAGPPEVRTPVQVQTAVLTANTTDVQAVATAIGGGYLKAIQVTETVAAAATLTVRNGTLVGDPALPPGLITLAASESRLITLAGPGSPGVPFTGLFVDRATGTTSLVLYYTTYEPITVVL